MTMILITGATRGLGREAARRLIDQGHDVWIGARDPERGAEAATALGNRSVALDVTDDASVAAAAHEVTATPGRVENSVQAPAYTSSKAALTTLTAQWVAAFPELRVNSVDPGCTATEFNASSGPQIVEEGTDAIVAMATIRADGPTGTFSDRHGPVGW